MVPQDEIRNLKGRIILIGGYRERCRLSESHQLGTVRFAQPWYTGNAGKKAARGQDACEKRGGHVRVRVQEQATMIGEIG